MGARLSLRFLPQVDVHAQSFFRPVDKTAFTSSARKKNKDSIFLKKFFENEFLKDMEIYQKKTN